MTTQQIISDIGDSQQYTLHAHTQYCDGRATMTDFIEKASELGYTHYGFTPHSPLPFYSSCNMSVNDVPLYLNEADRLQEMYPQIKIYKGMEVDFIDAEWGPTNAYFTNLDLDYMIGSIHFIPNQEGEYYDIDGRPDSFKIKLEEKFHGDLRYVVEKFYEQSQLMLSLGGFQILGHFDKIKLNAGICMPDIENTQWYNKLVNDLIDTIISKDIIVEINTKSWTEFRHIFPAQRHWRRLLQVNVSLVVNSDVHYVDRIIAHQAKVHKAIKYLRAQIHK